jgi:NADH-quinone oxidoreductase subunit H
MIAFYTLMERKIMASVQRRKGPNVNGFHGLLQPLADGLKLLFKEIIVPTKANKLLFIFSPIFFLGIALSLWSLLPFDPTTVVADPVYSALVFIVFSGLSIYGVIFAGWSSNSKYPFLGALRAVAQMISYEVILGFIILLIALITGTLNFLEIVQYQLDSGYLCVPLFILCFIYFIVILAETNRAPFDLAEAESELVAGYNVEYSGILFAMFFLAEYSNMIALSCVGVIYFFGGWSGLFFPFLNFILKTLVFMFLFVLVRAVLPRYRYDQLMFIGWRFLLPITMSFFVFTATYFYVTNSFFDIFFI